MTELEGLVPPIAQALAKRGYETLTPVQQAVLDPKLGNSDVLVSAQTGSGKTVAFGIALATTLLGKSERFGEAGVPMALAIAPTRELALQVQRELEWLFELTGAVITSCVGGMDMRKERRALERGAHIVIGTPGRLCDHIRRNGLDISALQAVVLDEADEMLDLGFREDLEFILEMAPTERRTLMFSATVPRSIATLAKNYQRDAVRVTTASETKQHVDIEYRALAVAPSDRENAIINVLRYYEAPNAIVFCSTRAAVNHLTARFNNRGFSVVALSGELSQSERTHALQAMRDGRARVCIATDVAARGIDLPGLDLVVHADLPTNPETLLHRSGRTGRAGRQGVSAIIVPTSARRRAERLLDAARINATWAKPPSADEVSQRDDERLLADPLLTETVREDEKTFVERLLKEHSPEQVAAAFLRQYRAGHSAPEDLVEVAVSDTRKKPQREDNGAPRPERGAPEARTDFTDGKWVSLSVGRKQNAEPRWLIPMICRYGELTKRDIGAIRMQPEETYVELSGAAAERFLGAIGPNLTLEKGIRVKPLNGAPDMSRPSNDGAKRPFADRKPRGEGSPANARFERKTEGGDRQDKKPWVKKAGKPDFAKDGPRPSGGKPKFKNSGAKQR